MTPFFTAFIFGTPSPLLLSDLTMSLATRRVCLNKFVIPHLLTRYFSRSELWLLIAQLVSLKLEPDKSAAGAAITPVLAAAIGSDSRAGSGSVPKELHFSKKATADKVRYTSSLFQLLDHQRYCRCL